MSWGHRHDQGGTVIEHECPVIFQTHSPGHHFFGYYDKSPIDARGERLLSQAANFDYKRMPRADDVIDIGYWNLQTGDYTRLAETRAYNWQQGSQLQWLGPDFDRKIIFNDRNESGLVSRIVDTLDGDERVLPFPVYSVSPNGQFAICANYPRLAFAHPGYHYEGPVDACWDGPLPEGDGLFRLDLESGNVAQILSTRAMTEFLPLPSMLGSIHYLEHAMLDAAGKRFHFLHRWQLPDGGIYSRLLAANADGSDTRCLSDTGYVSHCCWSQPGEVVGWGRPASGTAGLRRSRFLSRYIIRPLLPLYHTIMRRIPTARAALLGDTYLAFPDREGAAQLPATPLTAQKFPDDGHCTFRPGDSRWMLTDTYDDPDSYRHLFLYDREQDELIRIGRFYSEPETNAKGYRADLHPRWDFSGTRVIIDSTHERGERQMYVIDVSEIVGAGNS